MSVPARRTEGLLSDRPDGSVRELFERLERSRGIRRGRSAAHQQGDADCLVHHLRRCAGPDCVVQVQGHAVLAALADGDRNGHQFLADSGERAIGNGRAV
jgi:hypothetical protein